MSDRSSRDGANEIVLAGGGITARFDGQRLRLVQGATTWTVPVRALRAAELTPDGDVRIDLSGDPGAARHGLGAGVSIPTRNAHAARAFTESLQRALDTTTAVPDGHALVLVDTRQPSMSPRARRGLMIGIAAVAYAAVLLLIGQYGAGDTGPVILAFGWLGPGGLGLLYFCWVRLIRDLVVLRRRGITVSGRSEGTVRGFGGNVFYFQKLSFRTAEGRDLTRVESRGSVGGITTGVGRLDVTYDPLDPSRATGPLTVNHVGWTLVLVICGLVATLFWAVGLYVALTG
ncbi:hypothetical protein ACFY3G_34690 [Streptomyces phaeochromogenes]|uniref:hypothetical protein n=1 Tax=Streptomyces phaeochromogenes TaxID=1923 RepID=UPI00367B069E